MKLLLIEDDPSQGHLLVEQLTSHHWVVERATDGETGLAWAKDRNYDLILLDIGLPKLDGITVCRRLRSGGYQNPILLLTGKDSTEAQVAGFEAGADDYVIKPFKLEILLARMWAVVRKVKSLKTILTWETVQLDPARGEVTCNGKSVRLTAKEFGLLELFLLNPKHIYTRQAILDRLWDVANSPGEETVSTHIKSMRQKLKAAGSADPIETIYGLGYRLRSPALSPTQPPPSSIDPSPTPTPRHKAQAVTSRVWQQFKTQYLDQINCLKALVYKLQPGEIVREQQQEAEHLAHKLVGSMGMFGFVAASQQAQHLERLMQSPSLDAAQIQDAIQWVDQLQQAIEQAQLAVPLDVKPSSPAIAARTQVLIVDDDQLLADCLRIEAIAWNLQVEIATDLNVARQKIAQTPPHLILLDLSFPEEQNGLTLMQELEQRSPKIPVIIFTAREDLRHRVEAVRLGASAFLHKPLPTYEILKAVTNVLNHQPHHVGRDRILIVDDDPGFLQLLSTLLSSHGVQVTTSSQPQAFWQVLETCHPDLLILDLEMPEFNGIELCQVVRSDPQWQHLKVVFLSAHTEEEAIGKGYAAGADDYLSKSMPGTELVTQILYRLSRG